MEGWKQNKIRPIFNLSNQVIAAGIVFAVASFLFLLDFQKSYVSFVDVLVIPKSNLVAGNEDKILSNMEQFSKTFSFYQKLLQNNPDINNISLGKLQDKQQQLWNDKVKVARIDRASSILQISVYSSQQSEGELLSQKIARNLIDISSKYYNVEKDIDFRVIDGPITKTKTQAVGWIILESIILGFALALVLEIIILWAENKVRLGSFAPKIESIPSSEIEPEQEKILADDNAPNFEEIYRTQEADVPFSFEQFEEKKSAPAPDSLPIKEMEGINRDIQKNIYPNFPEMPKVASSTASAPDNLPIADDFSFNFSQDIEPEQEVVETPDPAKDPHREPTEEEMKARLNQLLKGHL